MSGEMARSPDRTIGHRSGRLERRKHCAGRLWLPGHPAACYRPRRSRVHLLVWTAPDGIKRARMRSL